MQLNGSQIFVEVLCEQGVDTIFGYPGGAVLNLYDELYKNADRLFIFPKAPAGTWKSVKKWILGQETGVTHHAVERFSDFCGGSL